jgi:hypothetical protein
MIRISRVTFKQEVIPRYFGEIDSLFLWVIENGEDRLGVFRREDEPWSGWRCWCRKK